MSHFIISLFIFFLLLTTKTLYAQQDSVQAHKVSVLVSPAVLFSYEGYWGWQTGVQYRFNNRLSSLAEAAFPINLNRNKEMESEKFLRLGAEVKRYRKGEKKTNKRYNAVQIQYAFRHFSGVANSYYLEQKSSDSLIYYDRADIQSPVLTVAVKLGREFYIGHRWMFDLFTGVGTKSAFTSYSSIENPRKGERFHRREGPALIPLEAYLFNRTITHFHYTLGFRIGYNL